MMAKNKRTKSEVSVEMSTAKRFIRSEATVDDLKDLKRRYFK